MLRLGGVSADFVLGQLAFFGDGGRCPFWGLDRIGHGLVSAILAITEWNSAQLRLGCMITLGLTLRSLVRLTVC